MKIEAITAKVLVAVTGLLICAIPVCARNKIMGVDRIVCSAGLGCMSAPEDITVINCSPNADESDTGSATSDYIQAPRKFYPALAILALIGVSFLVLGCWLNSYWERIWNLKHGDFVLTASWLATAVGTACFLSALLIFLVAVVVRHTL